MQTLVDKIIIFLSGLTILISLIVFIINTLLYVDNKTTLSSVIIPVIIFTIAGIILDDRLY